MTDAREVSFAEIKALMQSDIVALCDELAPLGRAKGSCWVGPNPSRGEVKGSSFKIWIKGSAVGAWVEYDTGGTEKGDIIDLPVYCGVVKDRAELREWALRRYGLKDGDPVAIEQKRRAIREKAASNKAEWEAQRARTEARARRLFGAARPLKGSTAWRYLIERRGIPMGRLQAPIFEVKSLERCNWAGPDGERAQLPAMTAAMRRPDYELVGVHRTYLDPETADKIKTGPAKKMMGTASGTAIRCWPGQWLLDKPLRLLLTEGIEDAFSCAIARQDLACWAVGSLNGLRTFTPPPTVEHITVFADNDWAGGPAAKGFDDAMRRLSSFSIPISVARAHAGKDANDLLKRERNHD